MTENNTILFDKPIKKWDYAGVALVRGEKGSYDNLITGDPCIVWDEEIGLYRMFYFALCVDDRGRRMSCNAQAISASAGRVGVGDWKKIGPVEYTNPEALLGGHTHKPWIMMDPYRPNCAAKIDGRFWLFTVSYQNEQKTIQAAVSDTLKGPWTVLPEPIISPGDRAGFDGYHVDTVTAYWFKDRGEILIFYKGYPAEPQSNQPLSSLGSSLCAAVMRPDETRAQKLGQLIVPSTIPGHWQSGWVSGVQLFPSRNGGWYGLMTGSPTPPVPISQEPYMREPAPSLGGWASTSESWPIKGWVVDDEPIWRMQDIPAEAAAQGMGVNLWRHHILVQPDGSCYLFCNSGSYGQERMFVRKASIC